MTKRFTSNTAFLVIAAVVVLAAVAFIAFRAGRSNAAQTAGTTAPIAADGPQPPANSAQNAQAEPALKTTQKPVGTRAPVTAATKKPTREPAKPAPAQDGTTYLVPSQKIYALDGSLAYEGDIDLRPTFTRIEAGERDKHRNDGSIFTNREGQLPRKARGYYTEWVIRTEGLREVGPQRLITGKDGEAFYTPDHYATFIRVR
jgi:ribonuclease T1